MSQGETLYARWCAMWPHPERRPSWWQLSENERIAWAALARTIPEYRAP